ncbi:MAG: hypothetical protein RR998_08760 [Oscillospiraceae bacterium]
MLQKMKNGGCVIVISHRLDELPEVSDRIAAIRCGKIGTVAAEDITPEEPIHLMRGMS